MKFITSLLIIILGYPTASYAEGASDQMGVGGMHCSEYEAAYKQSPQETDRNYIQWAYDYMSGLNSTSKTSQHKYRNLRLDPTELINFINTYCEQRPLQPFVDAVEALYKSLPEISTVKKIEMH